MWLICHETWLTYVRDMTLENVWHDSFICATWRDSPVTQAQTFVNVECSQKVKARKMSAALWVMSHVWIRHVTCMHTSVSHVARTKECESSRTSRHITHWHETCRTYGWDANNVLSPASHFTHMHESWHTYAWVMAHIRMSHVTHLCRSCYTYEWGMDDIFSKSCHTYAWVMSHVWMSHDPCKWSIWLSHVMNEWVMLWWIFETSLQPCESCHTYAWVMSHVCMSHVTRLNESCRKCEWGALQPCASCHSYEWVISHIWVSHVAHMNESCRTYTEAWKKFAAVCCSVLQCVAVCCSRLQCVAVCCCCSVLQCVAVCCSESCHEKRLQRSMHTCE